MHVALVLTILAIATGAFVLRANSIRPEAAPRRIAAPHRRRIAPELTAAAAAERWYDEA